jgi:hypothetical protein
MSHLRTSNPNRLHHCTLVLPMNGLLQGLRPTNEEEQCSAKSQERCHTKGYPDHGARGKLVHAGVAVGRRCGGRRSSSVRHLHSRREFKLRNLRRSDLQIESLCRVRVDDADHVEDFARVRRSAVELDVATMCQRISHPHRHHGHSRRQVQYFERYN